MSKASATYLKKGLTKEVEMAKEETKQLIREHYQGVKKVSGAEEEILSRVASPFFVASGKMAIAESSVLNEIAKQYEKAIVERQKMSMQAEHKKEAVENVSKLSVDEIKRVASAEVGQAFQRQSEHESTVRHVLEPINPNIAVAPETSKMTEDHQEPAVKKRMHFAEDTIFHENLGATKIKAVPRSNVDADSVGDDKTSRRSVGQWARADLEEEQKLERLIKKLDPSEEDRVLAQQKEFEDERRKYQELHRDGDAFRFGDNNAKPSTWAGLLGRADKLIDAAGQPRATVMIEEHNRKSHGDRLEAVDDFCRDITLALKADGGIKAAEQESSTLGGWGKNKITQCITERDDLAELLAPQIAHSVMNDATISVEAIKNNQDLYYGIVDAAANNKDIKDFLEVHKNKTPQEILRVFAAEPKMRQVGAALVEKGKNSGNVRGTKKPDVQEIAR